MLKTFNPSCHWNKKIIYFGFTEKAVLGRKWPWSLQKKERKKEKPFLLQPHGNFFLFCVHPSLWTVHQDHVSIQIAQWKIVLQHFYQSHCSQSQKQCAVIMHHLNTVHWVQTSQRKTMHIFICVCVKILAICLLLGWNILKHFLYYYFIRHIFDPILIDKAEAFSAHSYVIKK